MNFVLNLILLAIVLDLWGLVMYALDVPKFAYFLWWSGICAVGSAAAIFWSYI